MTQVFISYSRRDLDFVEKLAADLKAAGLDVWYDLSGLEGGTRWSREIQKAIRESQYVLIVLSPDSVDSKWVEEEFLYASELGKKIIPLFYKQCARPFGYRTLHFIDIQGDKYKQKFNEILRSLDVKPIVPKKQPASKKVESVPAKPEKKEESPKPKKVSAQRKWDSKNISILVALATLILVLVFGLPQILPQAENTPQPTKSIVTSTRTHFIVPTLREQNTPIVLDSTPTRTPFIVPTLREQDTLTATPLLTESTDDFEVEKMVLVPAGEFTMGSNYGDDDEIPVHKVNLDAFYMDIYEVTNDKYKECVDAGSCSEPKSVARYNDPDYANYPVVNVDWIQAHNYCEWRGGGLPSETQWEKAARGTDERTYPWGAGFDCSRANYYDSVQRKYCVGDTTKVGSYESGVSPYGNYDMAGNVWEWTADWYDAYPGNTNSSRNYGTIYRVLRGGAWYYLGYELRVSDRIGFFPSQYNNSIGFRCARDATP